MLKDDYVTESESLALLVSDKYEALAKNLEKQTEAINKLVDLQEQKNASKSTNLSKSTNASTTKHVIKYIYFAKLF